MPTTFRAQLQGPALAVRTAARRLAPLGARSASPAEGSSGGDGEELDLVWDVVWEGLAPRSSAPAQTTCTISWHGPARFGPGRPGSEAAIQALSGLMQVHGQDRERPRRLGLEVASVAAGVLAGQGILAALIANTRGHGVSGVDTSVLQAGLLLASHYVAAATCDDDPAPPPAGPAPGPPFATSDEKWFEIETLDPDAWRCFWATLGAGGADLGRAWTAFRRRYFTGRCSLPYGFHEATAAHTLAEVSTAAAACGVSLCRLRSYDEVLVAPLSWGGHPTLQALPAPLRRPFRDPSSTPEVHDGDAGPLPLAGLHVVEATSRMQGPLAGLLLRMLGADVTRVEQPGGDVGRMVPPLAGDTGSFFLCFNRGKRPLELDLTGPGGRAELLELVAGADVFLQNWRPGKAAEWSLEAEDLASANPLLVYAGASGWGKAAEVAGLVGTDFLVQAYTGVGDGVSPEGEPPFPSRVLLTDFMGALGTCEGVLHGLWRREQTGRGCAVGTSLLAGAMALQAHVLEAMAAGREEGRRRGRPQWGVLDRPVEAADGLVVLSVEDDAGFRRLCRVCRVDPEAGPRPAVEERVAQRMATAPAAYWEEELATIGIASAAVTTDLAGMATDPCLAGLFEPLAAGSLAPASPWAFPP